ncbi:Unknown protein [Striga hermonthica]|uniref:Uncharacterized protein n=1 Tax=Striga hermonthica TaxID=68872 RepID=A0A9N7R4Q8_STRHE|nr:Unknown protein [Striga hermonthica]
MAYHHHHPNTIFSLLMSSLQIQCLLLLHHQIPQIHANINHNSIKVKTEVFLSPKIELEPGLVSNKYYVDIGFPRGHLAVKSFNAELVDEAGNPVPLHETYLHHWVLNRYYLLKDAAQYYHTNLGSPLADVIPVNNSGPCDDVLKQYYGIGAETRKTATYVPDPYGVEVVKLKITNPTDIPEGYKEGWVLNVHAIDTRGARDRLGCTECRCNLYNVTAEKGYLGGLRCCRDGTRCEVGEGFHGVKKSLYLRYTVKYAEWNPSTIVPVKIYLMDVTDVWTRGDDSGGVKGGRHDCVVEYDVDSCPADVANNGSCIHTKTATFSFPGGGDVIYGVGHQHAAATGTTLYGEGGRVICSSNPVYGQGNEPGDEAGYVVGMSTCYPTPGSVKISDGEILTLVSKYSNDQSHAGVMGLFYILVAHPSHQHKLSLHAQTQAFTTMMMSKFIWPIVLLGVALAVVVVFVLKGKTGGGDGYEAMI